MFKELIDYFYIPYYGNAQVNKTCQDALDFFDCSSETEMDEIDKNLSELRKMENQAQAVGTATGTGTTHKSSNQPTGDLQKSQLSDYNASIDTLELLADQKNSKISNQTNYWNPILEFLKIEKILSSFKLIYINTSLLHVNKLVEILVEILVASKD